MRLWMQLTLAMILTALGPLLITGVRATQLSHQQSAKLAQIELDQTADQTAAEVKRWALSHKEFLSGWMTLFPDLGERSPEQQVGFLRAVYRATPSIVSVGLVSADGEYWVSANGQPVPPQFLNQAAIADSPSFKGRRKAGSEQSAERAFKRPPPQLDDTAELSQVFRSGQGLGATLWARGSSKAGPVLAVELNLEEVEQLIGASSDVEVALLSAAGDRMSSSQTDWLKTDLLEGLIGTSASFQYVWGDVQYRGAIRPVSETQWSIATIEPSGRREGLGRIIQSQLWLALLASLLVAVLAGFLLARPLSRPIELLKSAALDVANGALGKEVDTGAGGEIGELTAAFNHMSRSLRQNYESLEAQSQEIERFNRELQDRVEARTRELREAQGELVRSGQLAAVAEVGAGLAHELNNPLSGILGLAQVLRMKLIDSPEAALLGQMESEANRCREVVDTMLKLSERTHGEPKKNMIEVASLLSEVAKRSLVSFRQRGVALDVDETPSSLMVFAPREETVRILNQILQSMRAGLSAGASLRVVAEADGDEIKIALIPDRPVASGEARDDWMASGAALWVARQMLDQIEGRMTQPAQDALQWAIYLPRGGKF